MTTVYSHNSIVCIKRRYKPPYLSALISAHQHKYCQAHHQEMRGKLGHALQQSCLVTGNVKQGTLEENPLGEICCEHV